MVIGVDSEMAPAAGVGGTGYAMVFSRRLRNSFVQLLDRELCLFQVRGGGVERQSSSSIATATHLLLVCTTLVGVLFMCTTKVYKTFTTIHTTLLKLTYSKQTTNNF